MSVSGMNYEELRNNKLIYSGVTYVFVTSDNDNTNSVKLTTFIEP